jgi:hypothetical protein
MPYKQITQLPDSVKNNLSKGAQEIYKEARRRGEYGWWRKAGVASPRTPRRIPTLPTLLHRNPPTEEFSADAKLPAK